MIEHNYNKPQYFMKLINLKKKIIFLIPISFNKEIHNKFINKLSTCKY